MIADLRKQPIPVTLKMDVQGLNLNNIIICCDLVGFLCTNTASQTKTTHSEIHTYLLSQSNYSDIEIQL